MQCNLIQTYFPFVRYLKNEYLLHIVSSGLHLKL